MRRAALALLLAALAACGSGAGDDPARGGQRAGRWLRAEGERAGKPLRWELREDYAALPAHPQLLTVSWHYRSGRADGQPDAAQRARFAAAEADLRGALRGEADLLATLDYDGQHDWYFSAASAAAYHAARRALPAEARRDLALYLDADTAAEFYSTLRRQAAP